MKRVNFFRSVLGESNYKAEIKAIRLYETTLLKFGFQQIPKIRRDSLLLFEEALTYACKIVNSQVECSNTVGSCDKRINKQRKQTDLKITPLKHVSLCFTEIGSK